MPVNRMQFVDKASPIAKALAQSGWDRDSVLPFARRVENGEVVKGGGVMGSDWHIAVPQFAADALQAAYNVGSSKLNEPYRRDAESREAMTDAAGAIVGPMAGVGIARALAAPKGGAEVGVFGGRLAQTADQAALAKAEKMAADGAPREAVWSETGWFQGPDQKWRFEIDDSGARWNSSRFVDREQDVLGNAMTHNEAFDAYPDLQFAKASMDDAGTFYNPADGRVNVDMQPRPTPAALHELQHALQYQEGFATGGGPEQFLRYDGNNTARQRIDDILSEDQYLRLAGETEARAVETRANLTRDQRRARPPWLDYDVPEDMQIVRQR